MTSTEAASSCAMKPVMELGDAESEENKERSYLLPMDLFPMVPHPDTPWENGPHIPGFHHKSHIGMLDNGVGDRYDLSYLGHHSVPDFQVPPFTSVSELDCPQHI